MDRLWKIETAFEENPGSVSGEDLALNQKTMVEMVREVLPGAKPGLFEATPVDYSQFLSRFDRFKRRR